VSTQDKLFVSRNLPDFFADDSLTEKSNGTSDLFFLVSNNNIQLALKERRTGRMLAFENLKEEALKGRGWKQKLESASAASKILRNYEFAKVTAGIVSKEYTLVPDALFREGDEALYFKSAFNSSPSKLIYSQPVSQAALHVVFGIEEELQNEIRHLFQDPQIFHHSQALISDVVTNPLNSSLRQVRMCVHDDLIDVLVHTNKKLQLLNSFSWQTNEDILYYLIFICEQLEINPAETILNSSGKTEDGSELHQLLRNYFHDVLIRKKPAGVSLRFGGNDLPFHFYFLLYNLSMCG
jgi:hypothetical protein